MGPSNGRFHTLDVATGTREWTLQVGRDVQSPAAAGPRSVFFGGGDHRVHAVR
ncbi:MAG: PQQ-binding-like beta-propeller repeat protein [Chthonomonadales bacterium]|nr:PQQ-binding-like beta-propeller repeat protein [Chthonomonadales bacterium]